MSSKLKDARWQLAIDQAKDDRLNFYEMSYAGKQECLDSAQEWLESYGNTEIIDALAARFNKEDS